MTISRLRLQISNHVEFCWKSIYINIFRFRFRSFSPEALKDHGIRTFVQFVSENLELSLAYKVKVYRLVCDQELLDDDFMVGSCIEVKGFANIQEFTVWEGSLVGGRYRKSKNQSAKQSSERKPGASKAAAPVKNKKDSGQEPASKRRRMVQQSIQASFAKLRQHGSHADCPLADVSSAGEDIVEQALNFDWPSDSDSAQHCSNESDDNNNSPSLFDELAEEGEEESAGESDPEIPESDDDDDGSIDRFQNPEAVSDCESEAERGLDELLNQSEVPESESGNIEKKSRSGNDNNSSSGSSDSSSSSSSSSSDSHATAKAKPAGSAASIGGSIGERRLPISEYSMFLPGKGMPDSQGHELHYNVNSQIIRGHCCVHAACRRQRTVTASKFSFHNRGQGRPLGALLAWLDTADQFPDKASHMKAMTAEWAVRKQCRDRFKALGLADADVFLGFERPKNPNEESEPEDIV